MSNNNALIQKYRSQIGDRQKRIGEIRKAIRRYGIGNCKKRGCFEIKKAELEVELKDIQDDILYAGARYDTDSVVALTKSVCLKEKFQNLKMKSKDGVITLNLCMMKGNR